MTLYGYARVSTATQDAGAQIAALVAAGVEVDNITTEQASGARTDRPGLDELVEKMQAGDVLTVWKLDRLGRSMPHLVRLGEEFRERGIELRSITEGIDTTTPTGRLLFGLLSTLAAFERDLIRERTAAGLAAARASGAMLGRKSQVKPEQVRMILRLADEGMPQREISASVGVPRSTVGRIIRGEVPSLLPYAQREAPTGELM